MHKQVDSGQITGAERLQLLDQVKERLEKLEKEKAEAETKNNTKRVGNLTAAIAKAYERREKLENIAAGRTPHPLKKQAEIQKLRIELKPLLELEASTKGRLLSLKESQSMARKEEIDEEIQALELASRGWFESEELFQSRVAASRAAFQKANNNSKAKKAPVSSTTTSAASASRTTAWSTPGSRKKTPAAAKSKASKGNTKGGGGVFAAMMMDSDSD